MSNDQTTDAQGVEQEEDFERTTVPMVECEISADMTKWVVTIPAYEVDVLRLVHGADNVEVTDEDLSQDFRDFDADFELQRIQRKYGKNGEEAVTRALGNDSSKIARAANVSSSGKVKGSGMGALDVSVQRDHSQTAKESANTSTQRGPRPVGPAPKGKAAKAASTPKAIKPKAGAKPKSPAAAKAAKA